MRRKIVVQTMGKKTDTDNKTKIQRTDNQIKYTGYRDRWQIAQEYRP